MTKPKVALVKGENRYQNISRALKLIGCDLTQKIATARSCVIKPNFVSTTNQLATTHVDGVRALLDFLTKYTNKTILIAENAAFTDTFEGFKNFGYLDLPQKYNVKLVDLSRDRFRPIKIYNTFGGKIDIGISQTMLESDFRISIGPAKTHDEVIVTLSLKNMIMGSLDKRPLIHQGTRTTNINLTKLGKIISPHLSIIDGTIGMQGNGPGEGEPINSNFVVASLDPLAADCVATKVMGFNPVDVGYLNILGIPKKIEVLGEKIANCQVSFLPHRSFKKQLLWRKKTSFIKKIITTVVTSTYLRIQKMPIYSSSWFGLIKEPIKKILGY